MFDTSIAALRKLNALGYGDDGTGLVAQPRLQPARAEPAAAAGRARGRLQARCWASSFGIVFNRLYTLANMPIQRFGSTLISKGQFDDYMALLEARTATRISTA